MKCIIIEDQLPAQRILKKFITDMGSLHLVASFTDAVSALPTLQQEAIDILFLDIHLPKLSGIDFLKSLQHPPQVILTTAFQDYALESYELNVVDYLLKPFSFERFVKAVTKAAANTTAQRFSTETTVEPAGRELFIKSGYDHIRLKTSEIFYITADSDYTEVHLSDHKYVTTESLRHWEEQLEPDGFMRIHKSYLVNTHKISKISGNQVVLESKKNLPIGRAFKQAIYNRFGI